MATSLWQLSPAAGVDSQLAVLQSISVRHHEHHNVSLSKKEGKQRLQIQLPAQLHRHLSALLHPVSSAASCFVLTRQLTLSSSVICQQWFVRQLQSAQLKLVSAGGDFKCQLGLDLDLPCFTLNILVNMSIMLYFWQNSLI